jgi:hypothetical protein
MQKFQGPDDEDKIKYVWSDAAPETSYATAALGIRGDHDTSVAGDSQANGVAENSNRDIEMGAASLLVHAGIPLAYWRLASPCYSFGRNVAIINGISPYCERLVTTLARQRCSCLVRRLSSYRARSLEIQRCRHLPGIRDQLQLCLEWCLSGGACAAVRQRELPYRSSERW